MKVLSERDSFLLDYEVLQHLNGIKEEHNWTFSAEEDAKRKHKKKRFSGVLDLEVITRDILLYLGKSPAGQVTSPAHFGQLMEFLNTLDLMKAEKLQIVNSLPKSMVHLYGLVEECDQRFDEETSQGIIDKIDSLFPLPNEDEEEMAVDTAADEEEEEEERDQ